MLNWTDIIERGKQGIGISEAEALSITDLRESLDLHALLDAAEAVRRHHKADYVNTCGITNAKSGRCPEKCNFCSQSAFFKTAAPKYTTKESDAIVAEPGRMRLLQSLPNVDHVWCMVVGRCDRMVCQCPWQTLPVGSGGVTHFPLPVWMCRGSLRLMCASSSPAQWCCSQPAANTPAATMVVGTCIRAITNGNYDFI